MRLQSILKKSIVFITHDFDEALRLADRIAIMYHGNIEQIGSPEDIVLNPATDYVRKFTGDVPREKVLTAGSVMDDRKPEEELASRSVRINARVGAIAEYVLGQPIPVPVVDMHDQLVGVLHQTKVLQILFPDKDIQTDS